MNYIEVSFVCSPMQDIFSDILSSLLADIGFESFVTTESGVIAYIQEDLFSKEDLNRVTTNFPLDNISISYTLKAIEDKDWNEEWEKNYFKPLVIDKKCIIQSTFHKEPAIYDYNIVIDPKMAFGTGHHQTTELMIRQLLNLDLTKKSVLDMGCGTAILAILASMRGADPIVAIDIDRWAYENAIENITINKTSNIEVHIGGAETLDKIGQKFDIVLANINRNILLQDITTYSLYLNNDGLLLMSGFYEEDIDILKSECLSNGLRYVESSTKENWACVKFKLDQQ